VGARSWYNITQTFKYGNGKGEEKEITITARADGIWQFGNDHERKVAEELDKDTDRAAAIIVASLVEARLHSTLLCRCAHVPKVGDRLLGIGIAMGAFSVKIDLAYALKLVTDVAYKDLMILKNIRNEFAHDLSIRDFKSDSLKDQTMNMKLIETHVAQQHGNPNVSLDTNAKPRITVQGYAERLTDPRKRYLTTAQLLVVCLSVGDLPSYPTLLI